MPEDRQFDIYQSATGPVAITNAVRRQILLALAERELELGDIVRLTGKSKPTLSNLHMRELLAQGLVEEKAHPSDARRKIYRLAAKRIGASDVPIEELRGAVREYAKRAFPSSVVPLAAALASLAAGDAPADVARGQARALGAFVSLPAVVSVNDALTTLTALWEREGVVARAIRVDFERAEAEVQLAPDAPLDATAAALAGLVEGVLAARVAGWTGSVREKAKKGGRVTLTVRPS